MKKHTQDGKVFYTADISRSYKTQNGDWKRTSNFNHDELLNVAKLAERAEAKISQLKQQDQEQG